MDSTLQPATPSHSHTLTNKQMHTHTHTHTQASKNACKAAIINKIRDNVFFVVANTNAQMLAHTHTVYPPRTL